MSPAQPDRPTESSPPRKPRGARRWVWGGAIAGLLLVSYVGAYMRMRSAHRLYPSPYASGFTIIDVSAMPSDCLTGSDHARMLDTPRCRLFRPCVAVEEWWRNR